MGNSPRAASYRRKGLGRIARPLIPACAALAAAAWAPAASAQDKPNSSFDYVGWDSYLGGSDSSQFSSLDQINKDNVNQLEVAWTYETGTGQPPMFNPTLANGKMYVLAGDGKIAALDPATGRELWKSETTGRISGRGINYWVSADGSDKRLVFLNDGLVRAVDARTGKYIANFSIDVRNALPAGHADTPRPLMRPVVSLFHSSRPVAGSSAAIFPSPASTYILPLASVGLNIDGCPGPVS